ncbi:MAG TPA: diguanylate cyclase [Nitrospirota bacterium]|nr:diguanylate cyclase [Nitrospirota bacterium]
MAKANILLVEDNKMQASIIKEYLEKNGYLVFCAEDGMSAFKTAKTGAVDLILLDRILPDIDGNDVCRWLKLDQNTKNIPIIMLTAKDSVHDRVAGLEAGADDYLPKPFDESELNARIYVRLRTKTQQDELLQKNRQLEDMLTRVETLAVMDSLTTLFNRRRFEYLLANEFKRALRYRNPLSCMMIDIDHFKKVNDERGHQSGDVVLKEVAQLIQASIREVDTPARWGGEEFVVLSPNTPKANAKLAADRILMAVSQHAFTGFDDRQITVSIGLAGLPDPSLDSQEKLLHAADLAMYEAKKQGRNRVVML